MVEVWKWFFFTNILILYLSYDLDNAKEFIEERFKEAIQETP